MHRSTSFVTSQIICNAIAKYPGETTSGILIQLYENNNSIASQTLRAVGGISSRIIGCFPDKDKVSFDALLQRADIVANNLGDNIITPEHLLLAIISFEECKAYQALLYLNKNVGAVEDILLKAMDIRGVFFSYKDDFDFLSSHWDRWMIETNFFGVKWFQKRKENFLEVSSENASVLIGLVNKDFKISANIVDGKKNLTVMTQRKSIELTRASVVSFLHGVFIK